MHPRGQIPVDATTVDVFPEGWFRVAYSKDLRSGDVVARRYFGRELAIFRTATGTVQVLDAYCAHLGAHLGVGGTVNDECLRCPFHAWEYGTDGNVKHIPYATRVPAKAAVRAWPTAERSGLVFMWFSERGAAPTWEPPELVEHDDSGWSDYAITTYQVRTSAQEIVENIFDPAHGQFVHANANGAAQPTVDFDFTDHLAAAQFEIDIPVVGGATRHLATTHGLGIVVNRSQGHGAKAFYSTNTPIDLDTVEVSFAMLTPHRTPSDPTGELSRRSAAGTTVAFEQDIPIWEHKTYRPTPLLCDGDRAIAQFRVWAKQFYPGRTGTGGVVDASGGALGTS
jgi:phenylpropionate dioxygenase-like ring-hydroxylating dioxygenase large terminal subunit